MFSPEKSKRKGGIERLKYSSGAQLFFGVGLVVCAIVATSKHAEIKYFLTAYFVGGYTCGIVGAVAGAFGVYTTYKALLYDGEDVIVLQKTVRCPMTTNMILGYIVFFLAVSGIMMDVLYLVNSEGEKKIHLILAVCILAGICLLSVATIISLTSSGICCQCEEYNQRMMQTYPSTVDGNHFFQGQTAFGQLNGGQPPFNIGQLLAMSNPSSNPVSQGNFGMSQQQPTSFGIQQNNFTAPSYSN